MDPEIRWRPLRPQALAWREWDDEFVVFNDDTGSTHHLNALGGEVMLALLRPERFWIRRRRIPFGTSLLALARRPAAPPAP